ncbi:hypothetical protein [Pelosinus sp. IPA-1]|uniref:hypothetical protein n=1 Tax=Pelosinus sp. IPA-1 TaxID=3029569 RepID=UPI002436231E|nr:hypothetical protein [Pelosinus sp. IPA-1]GMA99912.1 hypothetical protein PIPA1_27120 [Pelosinus sp. IPA-1]
MRKINANFRTAFLSEGGSFLQNKDYFAFVELDDFACYAIADGIDDDLELDSAKMAVTSVIRQFTDKPSMKKNDIKTWLKETNQELLQHSKGMRLKASITVVVTDYASIVYGLVGNTRLNLYREGTLIHKSMDQSLTKELMEAGNLPVDKISAHLERHNLYCYLGQPKDFNPEVSSQIRLADGDTLTLLTRGIWENVDEGEMADAIRDTKEPQEALDNVEDLLMARQPENLENYTLATIFVDKVYIDPGKRKALIKKILIASIPILIILIGLLIYMHISQGNRNDQIAAMGAHVSQAQILCGEGNYSRATEEYKAALDLAQQLKLGNEQKDIEKWYKTTGLIMAADMALQQKDLAKAADLYRAALEASYSADQLGQSYILKQQRLTGDYMDITDLLQSGDQKLERKDYERARKAYLEAKVISTRIFYNDGRKEAAEKLAKIDAQMVEEGKKVIEEGQKAIEEGKKSMAQEAATYEQQGDRLAQKGDYQGAISMLSIAEGMYDQSGKSDKVPGVQKKISAIEDRMTASEKAALLNNLITEASKYERDGDQLANEQGDLAGAIDMYGLAMGLYNEGGKKEKTVLVQKKIDTVNDRKKNLEKIDLQHRAVEAEKEGDLKAAQALLDEARFSYATAQQLYGLAGLTGEAASIQKKIDLLDVKVTAAEQQKNKAAAYVAEADSRVPNGEYVQAKYLYILASDIYQRLGLKDEVNKVNEKLKLLTKLSNGKV